ncbi:MAG: T9SS type A sorting domain-containing protein [Candidatus Fermentibacteraceae bacterium]|nr:T9SS type A sorting domain-containing protein [Candidatus Fermentibacteraceae bacterium]
MLLLVFLFASVSVGQNLASDRQRHTGTLSTEPNISLFEVPGGDFTYVDTLTLYCDSFDRTPPPTGWGYPDTGSEYTYINPQSGTFSITYDGYGYLDDNSTHLEPWAFSEFINSSSFEYNCQFYWKYEAGVHSGVKLYNGDDTVMHITQRDEDDNLCLRVNGTWHIIEPRDHTESWHSYRLEVDSTEVEFFVDGMLKYSGSCDLVSIDRIGFGANGLGDPSDSWFDDVIVFQELNGIESGYGVGGNILLLIAPNPCSGSFSVAYDLPGPSPVDIGVYDSAGRLVLSESLTEAPAGLGSTRFEGLPSGVYTCSVTAGQYSGAQRVVVID